MIMAMKILIVISHDYHDHNPGHQHTTTKLISQLSWQKPKQGNLLYRTTTDVLHQTEELWQVLRLAYNVWSCIKRKSSENAYNPTRDVCDA